MRAIDRKEPQGRRRPEGEPPAPEPAAAGLLELQRTAGNAAVGRLLQRTHPAFNEANYWSVPLPSLESVEAELAGNGAPAGGGRSIARPGSPEAVLARLRGKFPEAVAQLLLHTEADGQDALDREPLTADFLADGGTHADAVELLTANPRDNAALAAAFLQRQRDHLTAEFLGEGGTRAKATQREGEEPTVQGLREAYHGDLLGDLKARENAAMARVQSLLDARAAMSYGMVAKPPEAVIQLRFDLVEGKRGARQPGAGGRAGWLAVIQRAEQWAGAREAAAASIPVNVRDIMQTTLPTLYTEPGTVVRRLFDQEPFDLASFNQAYTAWSAQPPVSRLGLQTPQQAIDGLVTRVRARWALTDPVARPIATQLYSAARGADALTVLENNAVPKATWDTLMTELTLDQTIEAVRQLQTPVSLAELAWRLTHRGYSAANLTAVALNPPGARTNIHRGRAFLYKGSNPHSIETELSITWLNDIWMPSGTNHWGEVHIHYVGRTALQANITYVHLKQDRAIPGGTAIPANHAIVAHAYNAGLLDPAWTV